ncbi:MAG: hypothetical protein JJE07_13810 [Flavobacteriaceae bacterium]|nr:hypothetical protein [Flavobacteriaceae bacterium]
MQEEFRKSATGVHISQTGIEMQVITNQPAVVGISDKNFFGFSFNSLETQNYKDASLQKFSFAHFKSWRNISQ